MILLPPLIAATLHPMNRIVAFWTKKTLFTRLFLYFLVVLTVPLALFASYYALLGGRNQEQHLMEQAKQNALYDAQQVGIILESYRHKAYQISTNELVISILKDDRIETNSQTSRDLYQLLFSTMRGDTYLASAHLVSNSGKVRVSTHAFPDVFDLRYHGNDYDMNSIISQNPNVSPTASIISIRGHRQAESNRMVMASILRRVYDKEGENLGYLVVEVFAEALSSVLSTTDVLADILLIDNRVFIASSLKYTDRSGPFTKFPVLTSLKSVGRATIQRSGSSVVAIEAVPGTDLLLAAVVSSVPYQESFDRLLLIFIGTMAVGSILAMILSLLFSRSISRPIKDLADRMSEVEKGNLQTHEVTASIFEFTQLEHSFNVMVKQIISLLELTKEEEKKLHEAERKALESQMNPHFLFNTLNTIKALAKLHDEQEIYTISVKLGKLLRSTIDNHESECTLEQSMSLIDSYLTIQKLRFGEKLHVQTYLDPNCKDVKTPKLIIQPLVENAIIHGLEPKAGVWDLQVKVVKLDNRIFISVQDNGVGLKKGTLPDNLEELANSSHVGVYNVYRRLYLKYKEKMHISIVGAIGEGTIVKVSFPAECNEQRSSL